MESARADPRPGSVGLRDVFVDGRTGGIVGPGQLRSGQLVPRRAGRPSPGAWAAGDFVGVGSVGSGQRHDRRTGRRRPRPAGPRRHSGVVLGRGDGIVRHRFDRQRTSPGARPHRSRCAARPRGGDTADVHRPDQRADPAPSRRLTGSREVEIGARASPAWATRSPAARRAAGSGALAHRHRAGEHHRRGHRPRPRVPGVGL